MPSPFLEQFINELGIEPQPVVVPEEEQEE